MLLIHNYAASSLQRDHCFCHSNLCRSSHSQCNCSHGLPGVRTGYHRVNIHNYTDRPSRRLRNPLSLELRILIPQAQIKENEASILRDGCKYIQWNVNHHRICPLSPAQRNCDFQKAWNDHNSYFRHVILDLNATIWRTHALVRTAKQLGQPDCVSDLRPFESRGRPLKDQGSWTKDGDRIETTEEYLWNDDGGTTS